MAKEKREEIQFPSLDELFSSDKSKLKTLNKLTDEGFDTEKKITSIDQAMEKQREKSEKEIENER